MKRYDVVIVGGGPAGLATAISFLRHGPAAVLVVDGLPFGRQRIGETVPPDLLVSLGRLGLDDHFRAGGHVPVPGSSALWGRDRVGHHDAVLSPLGPPWRLHRRRFDGMLARRATALGARVRWGTRCTALARTGTGHDGHVLTLRGPDRDVEQVAASWVVDASGSGARIARRLGAQRAVEDRLVAVVRTLPLCTDRMSLRTLVEATPTGWWYAARLPDRRVIVMFVTDRLRLEPGGTSAAHLERALADTRLVGPALAGAVGRPEPPRMRTVGQPGPPRVRTVGQPEPPRMRTVGQPEPPRMRTVGQPEPPPARAVVLPVTVSRLEPVEGPSWLAVGDAASSWDPLVGHGLAKGIEDGVVAGRQLAATFGRAPAGVRVDRAVWLHTFHQACRDQRAQLYAVQQRFRPAPFWAARARPGSA